jgi:predicted metalloprotease
MTKIRGSGDNPYIDDRRGDGGAQGGGFSFPGLGGGAGGLPIPSGCGGKTLGAGGGGLALVIMLAALLLPKLLNGGDSTLPENGGAGTTIDDSSFDPTPGGSSSLTPDGESGGDGACDTQTAQIVCGAVTDVNEFWTKQFQAGGSTYTPAITVFFSGSTSTACGTGTAQSGPFYCPADSQVYFDLDFLDQLQRDFSAQGDLAAQYIVAHEYGHHIQNLLGISGRVRELQRSDPANANEYSVKLELQADCLAGVWAHDANARNLLEPGEVTEALEAARAVGDDRIQRQSGAEVNPETWTHGSSEQREQWFRAGFDTGDTGACNTFA